MSREQAEAELTVLASRIEMPDGETKQRRRVVLTPHIRLPDPGWRAEAASAVALLSAVTALVLLIVCCAWAKRRRGAVPPDSTSAV